MAGWPLAARAQQRGKLPTIGFLNSASVNDWSVRTAGFRQGLSGAGFTEGQTVALAYRYAPCKRDTSVPAPASLIRPIVSMSLIGPSRRLVRRKEMSAVRG